MNLHKVIEEIVQVNCRFVMLQTLAKSIGEAGKPALVHPHGKVLTFNVARR
jgi:hypothetical protein